MINMTLELNLLETGMEIRAKRTRTTPIRILAKTGDMLGTDSRISSVVDPIRVG